MTGNTVKSFRSLVKRAFVQDFFRTFTRPLKYRRTEKDEINYVQKNNNIDMRKLTQERKVFKLTKQGKGVSQQQV